MDPFTDQALIEDVRSGSRLAFDELMRRYERMVYRVCFSYTRDSDEAMDVTQDVFLKVYSKLGTYRSSGAFRNWLLRVAHHENVSALRRRRRHGLQGDRDETEAPESPAEQESALFEAERRDQLAGALGSLNPKQQLAVTLRYYEDLSIREIAAVLKTTEGNTRSLLFRSLQKLRTRLGIAWRENPA